MSKSIIEIRRKSDGKVLRDEINDACQTHNIYDGDVLVESDKDYNIGYLEGEGFLDWSEYELADKSDAPDDAPVGKNAKGTQGAQGTKGDNGNHGLIELENFLDEHFNGKTYMDHNDRIPVDVWARFRENGFSELGYSLDVGPDDGFRYFVERDILKDKVRRLLYILREVETALDGKILVTENKDSGDKWERGFDTAIECLLELSRMRNRHRKHYEYRVENRDTRPALDGWEKKVYYYIDKYVVKYELPDSAVGNIERFDCYEDAVDRIRELYEKQAGVLFLDFRRNRETVYKIGDVLDDVRMKRETTKRQ